MSDNEPEILGILMLDTRFPRVLGDIGNPETWPFEVRYGIVNGATPKAIVCDDVSPFVDAFIAEGRRLVAGGCTAIATTCGFLSLIRPRLAADFGVPITASALEQAPMIAAMLPKGRRIGILTISAGTLTSAHLDVAGVPRESAVQGMEGSGFARSILENATELDLDVARSELAAAARNLISDQPDVGAIILECTNMVPFAPDIASATGRPVFSIYTYLRWLFAGMVPQSFN